jgi:phosphate transport system substrate-binding protein
MDHIRIPLLAQPGLESKPDVQTEAVNHYWTAIVVVRNQNGEFVEASLESIEAAVHHSMEIRNDFKASIVDAPGQGSYPIASFTWFVVPTHITDAVKRTALTAFLRWMLAPGQQQAAALGYVALPKEVVAKEEDALSRIH